MKRENIEQLLVDYANDSLSAADTRLLEDLFETNPLLKEEAKEMADAVQALNRLEEYSAPKAAMDTKFYEMLQAAKNEQIPAKSRDAVVIKMSWLKAAASVAACIIAFIGGRFTVSPVEVVKYQKVIVKELVPNKPQINNTVTEIPVPVKLLSVDKVEQPKIDKETATLAAQLRSVFVSERIDAIMQLASKPTLSNDELRMMQLSLSEDPNANVRLTVLNTLRPLVKQQNVQNILISSLKDQHDIMVQSAVIDILVDARLKQAIPQMIVLLDDKKTDILVQNKIKGGIESFLY